MDSPVKSISAKIPSKPVKPVKAVKKDPPESVIMTDYDDGYSLQDFNCGFEEYFECENEDAAYIHDNGMVWDKNEKYIGKFTDDGFVKAS
jgi:hypothetical protein